MKTIYKDLKSAIRMILLMTVITGAIYPLLITGFSQLFFPLKANGSLVTLNNRIVGSSLIGQPFTGSRYFQPRPSASDYDCLKSGGSNLGPTSFKLADSVSRRITRLYQANSTDSLSKVPAMILFASASGLDPHTDIPSVIFQAARVGRERGFTADQRKQLSLLINRLTEPPQFGFLGEERINILMLNLELDKIR